MIYANRKFDSSNPAVFSQCRGEIKSPYIQNLVTGKRDTPYTYPGVKNLYLLRLIF